METVVYLADSAVLLSVRVANKILIRSNNCVIWAKEQKEIIAWLETGKQTLPHQTGTVGVNERLRVKPFFLAFCIVLIISKKRCHFFRPVGTKVEDPEMITLDMS